MFYDSQITTNIRLTWRTFLKLHIFKIFSLRICHVIKLCCGLWCSREIATKCTYRKKAETNWRKKHNQQTRCRSNSNAKEKRNETEWKISEVHMIYWRERERIVAATTSNIAACTRKIVTVSTKNCFNGRREKTCTYLPSHRGFVLRWARKNRN